MGRGVVTERGKSGMILSTWEDGGTIPEMGKTGGVRRRGLGMREDGTQEF